MFPYDTLYIDYWCTLMLEDNTKEAETTCFNHQSGQYNVFVVFALCSLQTQDLVLMVK